MQVTFITVMIWSAYVLALYFLVFWLLTFIDRRPEMKKEHAQKIVIKNYPLVSIIVPAYNEERTIKDTLNSLCKLHWPKEKLEIFVIDDGSTDKTAAIVKRYIKSHAQDNIQLIQQKNQGKAVALNHGLKILKGKYFACLDADSFVEPETLRRMIFWHQQDPEVAIVTPVMKVNEPKNWVQKFQRLEYMAGMLLTKLMSYMHANYVAPGPFSVYKTAIIRKLGGFDEDNLVEDQEIAYRAQVHHYKIMQAPRGFVHTVAPYTVKQLQNQRNRWVKGSLLNIIKYRGLMFNRKYGDFGVFQMPLNLLAFVFGLVAFISFSYYTIRPLAKALHRYWLVGFDLWPYLQDFSWRFDILTLQITPIFILYLMLILSVIFLYLSSRANDDKVRKYGFLHIIPYFFLYFLILSYVTVRVIIEVSIGKKQKW